MAQFILDNRPSSFYTYQVHLIIQLVFFIFACASATLASEPMAKIQGIMLGADSMYRDSDKETVELDGNVQIIYQGQHIKADRARIYLRAKRIECFGNVEIVTEKSTIGGQQIFLDYENNTGVIYDGYVQSGQVIFEGKVLQKTGDNDYYVAQADYTTCTNCPASWSFRGTSIRAELGGYAYIKNSILKVGHVPILWLPYLIVPLKSDRQTGLLTPGFEKSDKGGLAISVPFFWAISRSTDLTLVAKNYEKRGLKTMATYRYVPNETSYGELNVGYLEDRVFKDEGRLNTFRPADQSGSMVHRWFTRYNHFYEMPENITHRTQINLASDLQYPKDFSTETLNHGDSAMENRMSVTKNTESQHFSVDSSYYVNLLQANPLATTNDSVHRLPELRYSTSLQPLGKSNFLYSVDLDYVNFARSGPAYDDLTAATNNNQKIRYVSNNLNSPLCGNNANCIRLYDGQFNPQTDLIRTGQRFDIKPTLYHPFKVADAVDILPKLTYRETHYNFNIDGESNNIRRYLRAEVSNRLSFSRVFVDDPGNPQSRKIKHEIIPEITYTGAPWVDHPDHPFFGTAQNDAPFTSRDNVSDGDLGSNFGLQFDYNDRIYDRNLMTFAIANKLIEKRWNLGVPEYRQIALFRVSQSYDIYQDSLKDPSRQPWSDVSATLDVRLDRFQTYSLFNYFPYQRVTNASSRVRLMNDQGQFFQVGLTKQYKITPGQDVDTKNRIEDYTIASGFISRHLNLMGRFVYDANWANAKDEKQIKSWAYIAQFKPPGDCWLITFIHDQVTGGDTNFRLSFEFTFDGIPKAALQPDALDNFGF